ncbi:unnamed protein product, partial [Allacma fusca]
SLCLDCHHRDCGCGRFMSSASIMMNCHCQPGDSSKPRPRGSPPSHHHQQQRPGLDDDMSCPSPLRYPFHNSFQSSPCLRIPSLRLFILHVLILLLPLTVNGADIGKYFTQSPQSIVAPPGDRVTFQCETNIRAEQLQWKLNGRFLDPENETDIRISGSFLVVKLSKNPERYMQQVGDYQCVAEFGAEALTSLPAQLSIARMESFKPQENKTLVVVQGNSVAIECDPPYSNPSPIIQFFKDGLSLETETAENLLLTDSGVLFIQNVTLQDSGIYWCSVTNHITTDTIYSYWGTKLVVQPTRGMGVWKPPEFLVKPKPYVVVPKDGNATLECVAIGNPPPMTSFRKLRAPAKSSSQQTSRGNLNLINAGLAHEGEYVCEAYNGIGETVTTISTVVLNSMPNITREPKSLVVEEGGEALMDCATEGLPKPRVYWVFNGHNVHDDGNIRITDGGLRISQVEKKHAGLFQCFATNPMGSVTSPAELKVLPKMITSMANDSTDLDETVSSVTPPVTRHHHGENHHHKNIKFHRGKHKRRKHKGQDMIPPSRPEMNRISDESVMIRWSVPPNSGYPIQFFKIQYKEVSKRNSRWMTIDDDIPPHIHSYEVRDLRVGHAYRFRIAAVYSNNDNKVGPNSEKFVLQKDATMRRPIYVPVVTTAAPHNTTTILLQWKHMRGEGASGGLDGYFIYYREATTVSDYAKVTVLGSNTDTHYITHLKPGTAYDIKIQAFNRAGASNFSTIVAAKTLGVPTTEKPEDDRNRKKQTEIIIPDDVPPPANDHLYLLLGCLFAGFWVFLCIACALCYRCKQKRAEEEAKYPCELPNDIEAKTMPNGHTSLSGHALDGYLPNISSHLDEKETSFVERHHNNNRPISPSHLNTPEDLATFKSAISLSLDRRAHHQQYQEPKSSGTTPSRKDTDSLSRNNSLQRKKHQHHPQQHQPPQNQNHTASLRRGNYVSCSSEDLDVDSSDVKSSKVFPKEHYKVSRKHSRKRNSMVDV